MSGTGAVYVIQIKFNRYFKHHPGEKPWQRKNVHIHLAAVLRKKEKNFAPIHAGIRAYQDGVPAITQAARRKLPKEPSLADNHLFPER